MSKDKKYGVLLVLFLAAVGLVETHTIAAVIVTAVIACLVAIWFKDEFKEL